MTIHYLPWSWTKDTGYKYRNSPCGITPEKLQEDDNWSDVLEDIDCPTCHEEYQKEIAADEADWKHEIAVEEGMLQGLDAYNEIMGWD